jgi:hypothetical protein
VGGIETFGSDGGWGIKIHARRLYYGELSNEFRSHGNGVRITDRYRYDGEFNNDRMYDGTLTCKSGVVYTGKWVQDNIPSEGTITYPDGFQRGGEWDIHAEFPRFDARHPIVKDCVEKKLRTNTLPVLYPQKMGSDWTHIYCESCWLYCDYRLSDDLYWSFLGEKCNCKHCLLLLNFL